MVCEPGRMHLMGPLMPLCFFSSGDSQLGSHVPHPFVLVLVGLCVLLLSWAITVFKPTEIVKQQHDDDNGDDDDDDDALAKLNDRLTKIEKRLDEKKKKK
jgi:hypothetical protein